MPCALVEPDNYPDYLKSILKEINAGNDSESKACACQLKTPVNDEGCLITDEDGKVLAFPFCLDEENPNLSSSEYNGVFYTSDIGLSYKDAMNLYWGRAGLGVSFSAQGVAFDNSPQHCNATSIGSVSLTIPSPTIKELICGTAKSTSISSGDDPRKTKRTDNRCAYGFFGDYYFGVEIVLFVESYSGGFPSGKRAWIDKEAQLIYPYIYALESLSGCCGNFGPVGGFSSSGSLTINTTTVTPGFDGISSGKIIVTLS